MFRLTPQFRTGERQCLQQILKTNVYSWVDIYPMYFSKLNCSAKIQLAESDTNWIIQLAQGNVCNTAIPTLSEAKSDHDLPSPTLFPPPQCTALDLPEFSGCPSLFWPQWEGFGPPTSCHSAIWHVWNSQHSWNTCFVDLKSC